jgi:hypothetical protein
MLPAPRPKQAGQGKQNERGEDEDRVFENTTNGEMVFGFVRLLQDLEVESPGSAGRGANLPSRKKSVREALLIRGPFRFSKVLIGDFRRCSAGYSGLT